MTQNTDLNIALFERAKGVIPGGVNSPVRALPPWAARRAL
jgi:glutamate-1-semialdehyde 2,1-aminomutase